MAKITYMCLLLIYSMSMNAQELPSLRDYLIENALNGKCLFQLKKFIHLYPQENLSDLSKMINSTSETEIKLAMPFLAKVKVPNTAQTLKNMLTDKTDNLFYLLLAYSKQDPHNALPLIQQYFTSKDNETLNAATMSVRNLGTDQALIIVKERWLEKLDFIYYNHLVDSLMIINSQEANDLIVTTCFKENGQAMHGSLKTLPLINALPNCRLSKEPQKRLLLHQMLHSKGDAFPELIIDLDGLRKQK